jgi:hypothetical protein
MNKINLKFIEPRNLNTYSIISYKVHMTGSSVRSTQFLFSKSNIQYCTPFIVLEIQCSMFRFQ